MTDARDYSQVIKDTRHEGMAQLYIKDKRNNTLWIEMHGAVQPGCSSKSLLHPDARPPAMRMQITQEELNSTLEES